MKVILLQEVKNLGKKGAVIEVAEGYGRNFLLPRGLAIEASEGNVRSLQEEKTREKAKADRLIREAKALRDKLNGREVTVKARAGEGGKLFGSITAKDIADALAQAAKVPVDKKKVEIKDPIRSVGVHSAAVKLGPDIVAEVRVRIVEE
jgi:large subunit ribosomal protein L9